MRVLVADDDDLTRVLIRGVLERKGFQVSECADGSKVLGMLFANELPQLLILDWMMPGADGLSICRAVREQANRQFTYIIMVTGRSERDDVIAGVRHGANDYIRKPVKVVEFEARLDAAVQMINLNNMVEEQRTKLVAASKFVLLGRMAAGVAHEINNPLGIVQGVVERLHRNGELADEVFSILHKNLKRISSSTRALQDFAAEDDGAPFVTTDLSVILEMASRLCNQRFLDAGVTVRFPLQTPSAALHVQPGRVCQVIIALLDNALRAVSQQASPKVEMDCAEDTEFIYISVTDYGPGVDPSIKEAMFLPFVTMRGHKLASGLGLSVSRGIAASQGGRLLLDPDSTHTRFVVVLPKKLQSAKV